MKQKEPLILTFFIRIDRVIGWFEVTQYYKKKAMTVGILVETM